jgi:hypothetical protein
MVDEELSWSGSQVMVRAFRQLVTNGLAGFAEWGCQQPEFRIVVPAGAEDADAIDDRAIFLVETRTQCSGVQVRVAFGDRERDVNTFVERGGRESELWEWVDALGGEPQDITATLWVNDVDRLRRVIDSTIALLRLYVPRILFAPAEFDEQLAKRREERAQKAEDARYAHELARITADAGGAFRERDFDRVIELLMPHAARLTQAQRRKLEYAVKHRPEV